MTNEIPTTESIKASFQLPDGYIINLGDLENDSLDPQWIQEHEGLWFKPTRLDTLHEYYTGYWYADRGCSGGFHYHSGATHGINIYGSMVFTDSEGKIISTNPNQYIYIPAGTTHKAEIITDNRGFLFYGTIEGSITYLDENNNPKSKLDVFNYLQLAEKHYKKFNLDINELKKIIVK